MNQFQEDFHILGKNICRLRMGKGISRSALAKATGMSSQTIKYLELGIVGERFGARQLFAIAKHLDCSVNALFSNAI